MRHKCIRCGEPATDCITVAKLVIYVCDSHKEIVSIHARAYEVEAVDYNIFMARCKNETMIPSRADVNLMAEQDVIKELEKSGVKIVTYQKALIPGTDIQMDVYEALTRLRSGALKLNMG